MTSENEIVVNVSEIPSVGDSARIVTEHMSRRSKAYLIFDNEIESLSDIETATVACWSMIVFCLSAIAAALWDIGFTSAATDAAAKHTDFGMGWIILWAVIAAIVAVFLFFRRKRKKSIIDKIKAESQPTP